MNKHFIKFRFLGVFIVLAVIAVSSAAVMVLWNILAPDIFGLPALNYWQAAGIFLLARILCGGIGGGHFMSRSMRRDDRNIRHGNPLREKWMNMTEEERKAFIEKEKDFQHFFHGRFSHYQDFFDEKEAKNDKEKNS
jgi:hypothetical protein